MVDHNVEEEPKNERVPDEVGDDDYERGGGGDGNGACFNLEGPVIESGICVLVDEGTGDNSNDDQAKERH